jgi:hypothetical protein
MGPTESERSPLYGVGPATKTILFVKALGGVEWGRQSRSVVHCTDFGPATKTILFVKALGGVEWLRYE